MGKKYAHPFFDYVRDQRYNLNMDTKLPNIFEYNNFRKYLEDYQKNRYSFDNTFSITSICRSLGLPNSRSYFHAVLTGRKVTKTFTDRFIKLLELNKEEALFFNVLVKFNQAEDAEERELYFDQLISLNKTPKMIIARNSYEYYKKWYNSAVRSILNIYDFNGRNFKKLSQMVLPSITEKNARDSIKLLKKLNLIKKNENGFYKPTNKSISSDPNIQDEIIKQYQLKCLDSAKNVLIKNRTQPQDISTNVLNISEEGYERIKKKLESFRSEIRAIVHKDEKPPDRVYQLDVLLFPNSTNPQTR
jgi:uncharacterized protein (TIGR02147 family)